MSVKELVYLLAEAVLELLDEFQDDYDDLVDRIYTALEDSS